MRIIDLFLRSACANPDRICVTDGSMTLSYDEVRRRAAIIAARLISTAPSDRPRHVGVLAPNCADALVAVLGIFHAGHVWVPANARNAPDELAAFLTLSDCDCLLIEASMIDLAASLRLPRTCEIIAIDEAAGASLQEAALVQCHRADELASLFPTGGTTGAPKAAMWSHRTWATMVANLLHGVRHETFPTYLAAAPLTHAAGVVALAFMAEGATIVIVDRAEPKLVMQAIEQYAVTTLFLPPTVIYSILADEDAMSFDSSSLQNLIYAAAPMSTGKLAEAIGKFGPVLVQTYGQAEAPMVCAIMSRRDHEDAIQSGQRGRLSSCGRPALLTGVAILSDEGHVLMPGETGEIAVQGDLTMLGYYRDEDATNACRSGAWQRTGDIGRLDADGFLYITDRKRDMIITGGFNVFPSEVEQCLWSHPAVKDCAVVGRPDPKWGEAVTAVVELKAGTECTSAELLQHCKQRIGGIKTPKHIEFWPELPRSPVGKVLKRAIRDAFWAGEARKI